MLVLSTGQNETHRLADYCVLYFVHMNIFKGVNKKVFYALLILSTASTFLSLPFLLSLDALAPNPAVQSPVGLIAYLLGYTAIFAVTIFIGLKASKSAGLKLPAFEGLVGDKTVSQSVGGFWADSLLYGMLMALLVATLELLFVAVFGVSVVQNAVSASLSEKVLAVFYGAVNVEIIFRLFVMSIVVFALVKLNRDKKLGSIGMWTAILVTGALAGLAQLPALSDIVYLDPVVVTRVVGLYVISGALFGYLYWKYGLLSAMMAHFAYDLTLFAVLPLILSIA